jgi:hypothetical protein
VSLALAKPQGEKERQRIDQRHGDDRAKPQPDVDAQHQHDSEDGEDEQAFRMESKHRTSRSNGLRYFKRTRVPLIFWLLSALRKSGTMRSINSKYDDSAGVFVCAL